MSTRCHRLPYRETSFERSWRPGSIVVGSRFEARMTRSHHGCVLVVATWLAVLGCSDATHPSSRIADTAAVPASSGISLLISAPTTALVVGEEAALVVIARDATGRQLTDEQVAWSSSSPATAQVTSNGYATARVKGLAAGVATVSATIRGKSQTVVISVSDLPAPSGGVVVVESFSVIEFQYPSAPNRWYYAPLVRLRETGFGGAVAVTGYVFSIPGFGQSPPCATFRPIARGATLDLFREVYGDYGYTLDNNGARATGTVAGATITVRDGSGPPTTLTVTGPIVSGSLPTTYTGGSVEWRCN